jgi:hypothetical protein
MTLFAEPNRHTRGTGHKLDHRIIGLMRLAIMVLLVMNPRLDGRPD